jgi:Subtilase family
MTATAEAPARHRPSRAARVIPLTTARLLWIELRRSPMPWVLPLIAALFWFDSFRPSVSQPPLWVLRTFWNMGQGHTILDFGPFVVGMAAWIGSRDGRRGTADLAATAARPRWAAQLVTWAAATVWAVGSYLLFVGVMFGVYTHQGLQGSPPWWWVAVGAVAVTAFTATGFAVGAFFPSRFAAPLAACGAFLVLALSAQSGFRSPGGWSLILPTNSNGNYQPLSGIFYPYLPDLPIARIMFLAGIAGTALGLLGLPARAGGPWLRRAAAVVTIAGVASAGTAVGLARTARVQPNGMVIPALHDAANGRPIRYTPVCGHTAGIPVCLNPAYRRYLPDVTGALRPVVAEVAGLPGAPARVIQVAGSYSSGEFEPEAGQAVTISGHPPVLRMPLDTNNLPGAPGTGTAFADELRLLAVHAFVGAGNGTGTPAQQAVQAALLQGAGLPLAAQPGLLSLLGLPPWAQATLHGLPVGPDSASGPAYAAAQRLAALPPAAWHAWLAAHLAALRSGQFALGQPASATSGTARAAAPAARAVSCGPPGVLPLVLCYTPGQYQVAYGVAPLLSRGIDGRGETVVVPELAETPPHGGIIYTDIRRDLATFDSRFGLPAARLRVVNSIARSKTPYLAGTEEVEDTEIVHAIAPGATLDVVLVPHTAITSAANFTTAVTVVVRAGIAQGASVISISASHGEYVFTPAEVARIHTALEQARSHHVTVAASSGDGGAVSDQGLPKQVSLPASDPLVLAVGGTTLGASYQTGAYQGEMAWNSYTDGTGGGYSHLFPRPSYQDGIPRVGATRGVPDVAADANDLSGMALAFSDGGIVPARGTSAATPLWAAVIALADQEAGQHLGFVNPALYRIARGYAYHRAFHDVVTGDNSVMLPSRMVVGYQAGPGWDPVTGWGSPNAQVLVPLLAHNARRGGAVHS